MMGYHIDMIKAVIFDFDGTLGDTEPFYAVNFDDTMKEYGVICDEEDHIAFIGYGPYDKVRIVEEKYGVKIDADEAAASFRKKNNDRFPEDASCFLFDDVIGCLNLCKEKGLSCYICSNTDSARVEMMVKQMGIYEYFDGISGKDLCGARKPSPVPYLYMLDKYGYQKDEVIVIEDSAGGVRSAKAPGLNTLGLERVKGLYLEEADEHITSLDDVLKIISGPVTL